MVWEFHGCCNDCTPDASGLPKQTARGSVAIMLTACKLQNYKVALNNNHKSSNYSELMLQYCEK